MELKPLYYWKSAKDGADGARFKELNVMDCMECGCCQYICSSKIQLLNCIRAGKQAVREMK